MIAVGPLAIEQLFDSSKNLSWREGKFNGVDVFFSLMLQRGSSLTCTRFEDNLTTVCMCWLSTQTRRKSDPMNGSRKAGCKSPPSAGARLLVNDNTLPAGADDST